MHEKPIEREDVMFNLKDIYRFLRNGSSVLFRASKGTYCASSESVRAIRSELMEEPQLTDRENLYSDRKAVGGDLIRAWNKLTLVNV